MASSSIARRPCVETRHDADQQEIAEILDTSRKYGILAILVHGREHAAFDAEDEIGIDGIFEHIVRGRIPRVGDHEIAFSHTLHRFSTEADRKNAMALIEDTLNELITRDTGRDRNKYFRELTAKEMELYTAVKKWVKIPPMSCANERDTCEAGVVGHCHNCQEDLCTRCIMPGNPLEIAGWPGEVSNCCDECELVVCKACIFVCSFCERSGANYTYCYHCFHGSHCFHGLHYHDSCKDGHKPSDKD